MNSYIFNYTTNQNESYTVIFSACKNLIEDDLTSDIKQFHHNQQRSNKVVYLHPDGFLHQEQIREILISAANLRQEQLMLVPYNENGVINPSELVTDIYYYGNLQIIKKNNIILHSDSNFHYVNPSSKHSPYFIRTANMLFRNEEINFVALQLLKFTSTDELTEIVCDTSSILTIPYAIFYLKSMFGRHLEVPVRSFRSYAYKDYPFKRGSLVLISASNSGKLEDGIRLCEPDLDIITIIFNSSNIRRPNDSKRRILLNINRVFQELIPSGHHTQQYDASQQCDYCNNNSIPVFVRDDQFIPSRVLIQSVLIKKHHMNETTFVSSIRDLTCNNGIFGFKSETVTAKTRDVFFDLIPIISNKGTFQAKYLSFLKNSLPASTNLIVYLEDKSSRHIAQQTTQYLQSVGSSPPHVISFKNIGEIKEVNQYNTILVVASCISTGNLLNAVAQSLRHFQNSSILYLIGLARLSDPEKLKTLRSNLESRQGTSELNKVHTISECFLPNNHSQHTNKYLQPSYKHELNKMTFWIEKYGTMPALISNRIKDINKSHGMLNNLFFKDPFSKKDLTLRPNFVFYDFVGQQPTQADVYFIMYCIIHCLRHPKLISRPQQDDKPLIQHEHVRSLISPTNFTRFNDGIIQASILRIARPAELDYSIEIGLSEEVLRTFKILFDKDNPTSSEAILEFLFSISIKKLKLHQEHLAELVAHLKNDFGSIPEINFFVKVIENEILS